MISIVWRVVMKSHTLNMENIIVNKREREKLNFRPVGSKRNNNSFRDVVSIAVVFAPTGRKFNFSLSLVDNNILHV